MMKHRHVDWRLRDIAMVKSIGIDVRMGLAGKHETHPDGPPYYSSNDELRVCNFSTNIHRIDMHRF